MNAETLRNSNKFCKPNNRENFILEFYNFILKYIDFWKKSDRTLIFNSYVYTL